MSYKNKEVQKRKWEQFLLIPYVEGAFHFLIAYKLHCDNECAFTGNS